VRGRSVRCLNGILWGYRWVGRCEGSGDGGLRSGGHFVAGGSGHVVGTGLESAERVILCLLMFGLRWRVSVLSSVGASG